SESPSSTKHVSNANGVWADIAASLWQWRVGGLAGGAATFIRDSARARRISPAAAGRSLSDQARATRSTLRLSLRWQRRWPRRGRDGRRRLAPAQSRR